MRSILGHASVLALLLTLMGCEKKDPPPYELADAGNGLFYRINKASGEVSLVAGSSVTKLEEWAGPKTGAAQTNYVKTWPTETNSTLGNLVLQLKTNWREGKMYYIFTVSPYTGTIETERRKSQPTARF